MVNQTNSSHSENGDKLKCFLWISTRVYKDAALKQTLNCYNDQIPMFQASAIFWWGFKSKS